MLMVVILIVVLGGEVPSQVLKLQTLMVLLVFQAINAYIGADMTELYDEFSAPASIRMGSHQVQDFIMPQLFSDQ